MRYLVLLAVLLGSFAAQATEVTPDMMQACQKKMAAVHACTLDSDCGPDQSCFAMGNPCSKTALSGAQFGAEDGAPADPGLVAYLCIPKADYKTGDTCNVIEGADSLYHVWCGPLGSMPPLH